MARTAEIPRYYTDNNREPDSTRISDKELKNKLKEINLSRRQIRQLLELYRMGLDIHQLNADDLHDLANFMG